MMLFMEGFGSFGSFGELIGSGKWFSEQHNVGAPDITTGRVSGSQAIRFATGDGGTYGYLNALLPSRQTVLVGFAMQYGAQPSLLGIQDATGVQHLGLSIDALRFLSLTLPSGVIVTSSQPTFIGRWHYVEMGGCISAIAGWVEVRLDGQLVTAFYGTATSRATANGNTRNAASVAGDARLYMFGTRGPSYLNITDLVIMDDTIVDANMPNNDFIGDIRVPWIVPTGPGAHTDFAIGGTTPAATNWQAVDQVPAPGDVSYVSSSTVGAIDTYQMGDLPASTQKVFAIRPQIIVRKDDAGARAAAPLVRWATGPLDIPLGTGTALQTSYGMLDGILEVRPDGQPWTAADVDALEMGVVLSS